MGVYRIFLQGKTIYTNKMHSFGACLYKRKFLGYFVRAQHMTSFFQIPGGGQMSSCPPLCGRPWPLRFTVITTSPPYPSLRHLSACRLRRALFSPGFRKSSLSTLCLIFVLLHLEVLSCHQSSCEIAYAHIGTSNYCVLHTECTFGLQFSKQSFFK